MCQCVQKLILDKESYFFIRLCISWIIYEMHLSYGYIIYEFRFMCLFIYFIVCVCIIYWIEVNLKILKTTLINRTRLRTKGQPAGYPQAQIEFTSN